jgi:hypothetical protein
MTRMSDDHMKRCEAIARTVATPAGRALADALAAALKRRAARHP